MTTHRCCGTIPANRNQPKIWNRTTAKKPVVALLHLPEVAEGAATYRLPYDFLPFISARGGDADRRPSADRHHRDGTVRDQLGRQAP
jgi:hypothetical protein